MMQLRIDGRPQRTGEDRRTLTLHLLPLLLFVANKTVISVRRVCSRADRRYPVVATLPIDDEAKSQPMLSRTLPRAGLHLSEIS